jgi:hypothetical protein
LRFPPIIPGALDDAVCINQTDTGKRNHQVFMMNRLYSAAERVLVWLGEARDHSDTAMKRLKELADGQEMTVTEKRTLRRLIFDCLIDRDWWGRLWVVQEVVLAKSDPIMICGPSSLPWSIFMKGYRAAGLGTVKAAEHHEKGVERLSQCHALYVLWRRYHSHIDSKGFRFSDMSLGCILRYTKDFRSTDPRDKIYGSLRLLSMSERETMKPDYQKPTELVYLEATQHLLEHDNYSFLSLFSFSTSGKGLSKASPSWVPDFSAQKAFSPGNRDLMTRAPDSDKIPVSRTTNDVRVISR